MPLPALLLTVAVVFAAGIGFAVQAPLNAALGRAVGSGVAAACISFGVGFAALLALTALRGDAAALARLPAAPPVLWIGGLFGAVVVWAMLWSVPAVGILTAFAALLLGQLSAALVLDAMGAFGAPVTPVSPTRVVALAMVAGGLILSRL
ncbi:DMT family transporter [Jannaschia sp. Os4]|uniref:DMT family transporter n=1 Tax=Jannaschia sp. Os4 TaxID=2807617 RepID=UPI001939C62A|nr:DMT family transporter [Jannaschia sp. Os4]MBM2575391.1 DMT family transporter [Jannaschia sp. Os4]